MRSHHDSLVKAFFANTEDVASALASALPQEIAERVDWTSLRRDNLNLVDQKLREVHSDFVFNARLDDREIVLYVLLEHQSSSDDLMPFRMLRYIVLLWSALLRDTPDAKRLPAVLPFLLHHGRVRWASPTSLADLINLPDDLRRQLGNYIPDFRFFIDDLNSIDDQALRTRSLTSMMRAVLVLLKKAPKSTDLVVELADWLDVFVQISRSPNGLDALRLLLEYISLATDAEPTNVAQFAKLIGPVAEDAYMTAAEKLAKQGEEKGRKEGQAELLLRLLTLRFGAVPDSVRKRVRRASDNEVNLWAERVLSAPSLEAVFAKP